MFVLSEISYTGIRSFKKSRIALMLRIKRLHDVLLRFLQASDMQLGCYQLQTGHKFHAFSLFNMVFHWKVFSENKVWTRIFWQSMFKVLPYFMTFLSVKWLKRKYGHGYKQKYVELDEKAKRTYMVKLSRPSEQTWIFQRTTLAMVLSLVLHCCLYWKGANYVGMFNIFIQIVSNKETVIFAGDSSNLILESNVRGRISNWGILFENCNKTGAQDTKKLKILKTGYLRNVSCQFFPVREHSS